ncbi:extensin family protein [Phenylobacterium sp.]|uniref:extensin-like domain-containing protein n=1 Tax=Phenylobacterium sp. TaxID=1871053 RepID=UPI0035B32856
MAYRVPRHPKVKDHASRQTFLARIVGLVLLWVLVAVIALVGDRAIAPQHLPWKPLRVIDPVGLATKAKAARTGADPLACRQALGQGGVAFTAAPPTTGDCKVSDALILTSGLAPLKPAEAALSCKEALALTIWERQVVQPAAIEVLGQAVVGLDHYGSFACRRIYGRPEGPLSEHASANALDLAGFRLADGSSVSIAGDWKDQGAKGVFLRRVRDGGCKVFVTVLSPDYNVEHADHLHLDMGGWPSCN